MIRRIQLTLLALFVSVWAMASYTSVKNADGVEIWYDFDSNTMTASVTYGGEAYYTYSGEYTGNVVIPSKVTYEDKEYSVTKIGDSSFLYCSSLTSITLPESVTEIGSYAFDGCSSLPSIDVALDNNSYTSIDGVLFSKDQTILIKYPEGKKDVTSYAIPESVTKIGSSAFNGCSFLTSITIPERVTSIGDYAFYDCSSLTSITIPESVKTIGEGAFNGCSSLTSITIPEGVTEIGEWAFGHCSSLTSIDVALDNNSYTSIDGVLFSKDKTILIQFPKGKKDVTSYIIPEGVTKIGNYAFGYCSSLTSITIPEGVTSIGDYAFGACSSLTSITIPENVTEIGEWAFWSCSSLISITIPKGVTEIGGWTFSYCSSLTSITIPEGVTEIGEGAFSGCSSLTSITLSEGVTEIGGYVFADCSSLTSITSMNATPPSFNYDPFFEGDKSISVYVPKQSVEAYKSAWYWEEFTNIVGKFLVVTATAENGTVTGAGVYEKNEEVTLIASPDEGYKFVKWEDGETNATRKIKVTEDVTLTAVFESNSSVTPITDVVADSVSIRLIGNSLIVEGAESYAVYALSGQCLGKVESLERGVYIVVVDGVSKRIVVK